MPQKPDQQTEGSFQTVPLDVSVLHSESGQARHEEWTKP